MGNQTLLENKLSPNELELLFAYQALSPELQEKARAFLSHAAKVKEGRTTPSLEHAESVLDRMSKYVVQDLVHADMAVRGVADSINRLFFEDGTAQRSQPVDFIAVESIEAMARIVADRLESINDTIVGMLFEIRDDLGLQA